VRVFGRVLTLGLAIAILATAGARSQPLALDTGAAGAWQKIRKLQTIASAMHTTAHPDDEHGGLLAMLSRGQGARLALLTLTRGESGDNAIGAELFDALGLIRTEELAIANQYYGVDRQYFTTAVDYGYSKRLDEALRKWGKQQVLGEVVRVIRLDRPLVLISRFQGNPRDGHGNHEAAGVITKEAFIAAGDPTMFPEQFAEGLQPWQPLKVYIGGVRENEDWTIKVDTGTYDPVLGDAYQTIARRGLSYQRSQNSGSFNARPGPSISYYKRVQSVVEAPARESSFFDGIDTTIPGMYRTLRKTPPPTADALLTAIDREIRSAAATFTMTDPSAAAPALARALAATRTAATMLAHDPDVVYLLRVKAEQIEDAIGASLGIAFTAVAQPAGTLEPAGAFAAFAAPVAMPPVVPGQTFEVKTSFTNRSAAVVTSPRITLAAESGWIVSPQGAPAARAATNEPIALAFTVKAPDDARLTRPYFTRTSIQDSRYAVSDTAQLHRPSANAVLSAIVRYEPGGVPAELRVPVMRLEANPPYGADLRVLAVVPAIGVTLSPTRAVLPLAAPDKLIKLRAEVVNNGGASNGIVSLRVPAGWTASPTAQPFQFTRAGERAVYAFTVSVPVVENREYHIAAVATAGGHEYREGYDVIRHRDLETRYLYRPASVTVKGMDVKIPRGLKVGYVMGVGDDVPSGIAQLGAEVQLLTAQDLAALDLSRFNAIVTGTRAYAVRDDLRTYNRRLLDYVRDGGNLIVLYNTPSEFAPSRYAPFPGEMPRNAEEVSEEDSPVDILAPDHPALTTPNRITRADFDQWVEQRGSKFWSTWDSTYTPIISTWDQGQTPQKGGWLHARYGKGHYTYFAYAFHRQLPYGVTGAYRLLANLLSLSAPVR
jgi:LmbE family N-acetylglucosaminyl deacetylase